MVYSVHVVSYTSSYCEANVPTIRLTACMITTHHYTTHLDPHSRTPPKLSLRQSFRIKMENLFFNKSENSAKFVFGHIRWNETNRFNQLLQLAPQHLLLAQGLARVAAWKKPIHRKYQFWRDFDDLEWNWKMWPRGSGRRYRPPDIDQALYIWTKPGNIRDGKTMISKKHVHIISVPFMLFF